MNSPTQTTSDNHLAVIGFPVDENSSFLKGAAEAPPLVRAAFKSEAANLWSENGTFLGGDAVFHDAGDLVPSCGSDTHVQIEAAVRKLVDQGFRPICLGGDHSISYPVVKALSRKFPRLTVLDFDAHPDLYDEFQGSRFSHACPFARIMEEGLAHRLIQVGIRTMTGHQREQARRFGVEVLEMKDWQDMLPNLESPLYISFDMDVLDPAFAPGVSHREPGGLSVRQAIRAIQAVKAEIIGADIVEFNPRMDPVNLTAQVCAKLWKELAAKMLESCR